MAHNHNIVDDDLSFIIDPETRKITNRSGTAISLIQYDHKSERFVFEIPRYIEGHDMLASDFIEIHFINTGTGTSSSVRTNKSGIYIVTDAEADDENAEVMYFSWLIEQASTSLAGTLSFQIKFKCYKSDDATTLEYIWNTDIFKNVVITAGIDNTGSAIDDANAPTSADANKLFYVDGNLRISYLSLGEGLEIKDGVLTVTL